MTTQAVNVCPDCDHPLMNTPSGAVCPKGHRGIFPKVSRSEHNHAVRLLQNAAIQEAKVLPIKVANRPPWMFTTDVFTIQGQPGLWARMKRGSSSTNLVVRLRDPVKKSDSFIEVCRLRDVEQSMVNAFAMLLDETEKETDEQTEDSDGV